MAKKTEAPGCRNAALATLFLLGLAIVFMAIGFTLTQQADCTDLCETGAFTLLYAGGPLSAIVGVVFGGIYVLWPLEVTMWVLIGFSLARRAERRSTSVMKSVIVIVAIALAYGLVLSQFVEMAV